MYDITTCLNILVNNLNMDNLFINIYDVTGNGTINSGDTFKIMKIINNIIPNDKYVQGSVTINSNNPKNCIEIRNENTKVVSLGVNGVDSFNISTKNFTCGNADTIGGEYVYKGITMNGDFYNPAFSLQGTNQGQSSQTIIDNTGLHIYGADITCSGDVTCNSVIQTSKEEAKKNFEKLPSGLDIIKNIDIYKYNLKGEEDDTKKHIGFVIGDNYNYSKEVTSKENDGADIYSFVSVCCKAIQEQQEQIEELKSRIEKLEKGDK